MDKITYVHTTDLAAVLLTLGFSFAGPVQYTVSPGGERRTNWIFNEASDDGRHSLSDVVKRYTAYMAEESADATDEIGLVCFALLNRRRLLDWVKEGVQMEIVRKGKRCVLAPHTVSRAQYEVIKKHMTT